MRIAVAGPRGFIGGAALRAVERAGHEAIGFGRGDVPRATCDVLVWAAGRREPTLAANRAVHVEAVVEVARALAVSRIVYLSTGECYGDAPVPYREDGPCLGTSDYARAKLEGERAVSALAAATVLRLGVVYGPGQAPQMMIPQLVAALRAGTPFAMSAGTQTRDFVFVDDVADAIVAAVAAERTGTFNIASGEEIRVRDAACTIARALGADQSLLRFGELTTRPGEALRYVLDISRARQQIGWSPRTSLAAGAARL